MFFLCKQKTSYDLRISDWSSDVCSSDLNAFLHDIYHRQEILRAGRVPVELISRNEAFLPMMMGMDPPGGVYTHISGIDIVRTGADEYYVLEDNARTPSGVSYMLENRETMLQMFPELFAKIAVREVGDYPLNLLKSLAACAPPACNGKIGRAECRDREGQ